MASSTYCISILHRPLQNWHIELPPKLDPIIWRLTMPVVQSRLARSLVSDLCQTYRNRSFENNRAMYCIMFQTRSANCRMQYLYVCLRQKCGIEYANHTLISCFNGDNNNALLLIDAKNNFNQLNRNLALHISKQCPSLKRCRSLIIIIEHLPLRSKSF